MLLRSTWALALCLAASAAAAPARAQPAASGAPLDYAARARATPARVDDATVASSTIELSERISMPALLADVLHEAPGAQVMRTGALGAFSSVTLRGGDADETLLMLDDVPLVAADGGTFDLSLLPPQLFERVEVYRGGALVWLNTGAIGGVVRLVPRRDRQSAVRAALGAGAFGSWQLDGGASVVRDSGVALRSIAVVRGSQADYPYLDDRGTRLDASDDTTRTRRNAEHTEATGLLDLELPVLSGRLHLIVLGVGRSGGFPGPASQPTPKIRRQSARMLSALSYAREGRHGRLQLLASGAYTRERHTDVFGQLGASRQTATDDEGLRGFARAAGTLALTGWLQATASLGYALDAVLPEDELSRLAPNSSLRQTLSGALELAADGHVGQVRLGLRPSARLEWSRATLHAEPRFGEAIRLDHKQLEPTFRLGTFIEPVPQLTLQAAATSGVRLPTMFELFGDRGLVLPSPQLRPVHSSAYDVGAVLRGSGDLRGQLELHAFHQTRRDTIAMFRTAQWQIGHENLPSVRQWGLEAGASGWLGDHFALHAALSQLYTRSALGKRLPFRPQTQLYARPELRLRVSGHALSSAQLGAELSHRGYAFVDRPNLAYVGACTKLTLSASLGFLRDVLRVEARLDDVADARCSDWIGYPLPGRFLFLTLRYEESFDEHA